MYVRHKYWPAIAAMAAVCTTGVTAVSTDIALANNAHAADSGQRQRVVSHRDLDLTRPGDIDVLDRRIDRAIRSVCAPDWIAIYSAARRRCVQKTKFNADLQLSRNVEAAWKRRDAMEARRSGALGSGAGMNR